ELLNAPAGLSGETDAVDAKAFLQPPHRGTYFRDLAKGGPRESLFHVDQVLGIAAAARIEEMCVVARCVLHEIVVRIEARLLDRSAGRRDELLPLVLRHIEVDRF